jgi:hypothetical protein
MKWKNIIGLDHVISFFPQLDKQNIMTWSLLKCTLQNVLYRLAAPAVCALFMWKSESQVQEPQAFCVHITVEDADTA